MHQLNNHFIVMLMAQKVLMLNHVGVEYVPKVLKPRSIEMSPRP